MENEGLKQDKVAFGGNWKENESKAGITFEHTFKPHVNHNVPNFEELQEVFLKRLDQTKGQFDKVFPVPFKGLEQHQQEAKRKLEDKMKPKLGVFEGNPNYK